MDCGCPLLADGVEKVLCARRTSARFIEFIVENAAAITVFGVVTGSLLLIAYFFSKIGTRKPEAASAPPVLPRSATPRAPGPTTPRVEARDHFGFRQAPAAGRAAGSGRWVEPKETVTVQGIPISGGLFYLGASIAAEDQEIDKYVINPKLPARSSSPDVTGTSMPYWPSYADIPPAARRAPSAAASRDQRRAPTSKRDRLDRGPRSMRDPAIAERPGPFPGGF